MEWPGKTSGRLRIGWSRALGSLTIESLVRYLGRASVLRPERWGCVLLQRYGCDAMRSAVLGPPSVIGERKEWYGVRESGVKQPDPIDERLQLWLWVKSVRRKRLAQQTRYYFGSWIRGNYCKKAVDIWVWGRRRRQ